MKHIIIIGTGLAGYTLAKNIRKVDKAVKLTLITQGAGHFYSKPLLSTALTANKTPEQLAIFSRDKMAQQLNADILNDTTVTKISPIESTIYSDKKKLNYTDLVLACGATPKRLIQSQAIDVVSVNHLEDYAKFRELIQNKNHITIMGAGFVGCEFANDLTNKGYQVTVVDPCDAPLPNLVPQAIGQALQQSLQAQGVDWHFATVVNEINSVKQVVLANDKSIKTDLLLSAVGLTPNITLAENAGIKCNHAIKVNEYLQTNIKNIYALGDCAVVKNHYLPYVAPLLKCAETLAKTLTGELTQLQYPIMPIIIKTPACPITVVVPTTDLEVSWSIEGAGIDLKALCHTIKNKRLVGFALSGNCTCERQTLVKILCDEDNPM